MMAHLEMVDMDHVKVLLEKTLFMVTIYFMVVISQKKMVMGTILTEIDVNPQDLTHQRDLKAPKE